MAIHRVRRTPALTKSEARVLAFLVARGGFEGEPALLVNELRFGPPHLRVDYAWKALAGLLAKQLVVEDSGRFRPAKRPGRRAA